MIVLVGLVQPANGRSASSKRIVEGEFGTESSTRAVGEMPRRRGKELGATTSLYRCGYAGVSVEGVLPPGWLCVVRAQQRTGVAGPSLGRPRHPCHGTRAILERCRTA